ncbi:MAG: hypothetical protein C0505_14080 [Leptothrix sp. (in: Bacteria)]|nr:hypothetical protein [Leptothrix sp. (in: b-proteobacteria)]
MNSPSDPSRPHAYPSTQPSPDAPRRRVGDRLRDMVRRGSRGNAEAGSTRLEALNPSLLQDLQRFASHYDPGAGLDLLEVLAAALRHNTALQLHLQDDERLVTLNVMPARRLLRWARAMPPWLGLHLTELRVLRVAPWPTHVAEAPAEDERDFDFGPMLWELALHGARGALLPEIEGPATYRVTPGAQLEMLAPGSPLAAAVQRLQGTTTALREVARWPGFDGDRAVRLLNALYLQSALIVTRSHPGR